MLLDCPMPRPRIVTCIVLAVSLLKLAEGQLRSLEVLVLDSPPFTCRDAAPCYSAASPNPQQTADGCRGGSRLTKNGVCVHGFNIDLLEQLERNIRTQSWADPAFRFNIMWRTSATAGGGYSYMMQELSTPGSRTAAGYFSQCTNESKSCFPHVNTT